jgi:hypothetical protein
MIDIIIWVVTFCCSSETFQWSKRSHCAKRVFEFRHPVTTKCFSSFWELSSSSFDVVGGSRRRVLSWHYIGLELAWGKWGMCCASEREGGKREGRYSCKGDGEREGWIWLMSGRAPGAVLLVFCLRLFLHFFTVPCRMFWCSMTWPFHWSQ